MARRNKKVYFRGTQEVKIDGVVVLYNPEDEILNNIEKYRPFLEHLYVVDNSTKINEELVKKVQQFKNVKYISLNGNKGIGKALKVGLEEAKVSGADVCLTMDQDSIFPRERFDEIKDYLEKNINDYAIIGLNFNSDSTEKGIIDVKTLLTSGNFINMDDYKKINGFNEDLFIDCVDFELNEQFDKINRKIGYINDISLIHKMGNPLVRRFLGVKVTALNHSPIRYYYRFRNGYYLYKQNKKFYKHLKKQFFSIKLKVMLYEPNKKEKFKMMRRGILDAKRNILGEFKEN